MIAAIERPTGRPAETGRITPRLAEILAAMVDAVLDAENALCATRGTVPIRRPKASRDRRPAAARRDASEVLP